MDGRGRTALITGASSGIGLELARLFAADGFGLVLVARNEDRLKELADELAGAHGTRSSVVPKDLADRAVPDEIHRELSELGVAVDVLVNNAGFGVYGEFVETDGDAEAEMLQVNVTALTRLSKRFVPPMVERGWGRVLNVASTAAFQPGPLMAVYYASKSYVLSLSVALAEELRGSGVTVTCLCPGPTKTEFQERADLVDKIPLLRGPLVADAGSVAREGYRGLQAGKAVVIPGVANRIAARAARFSPIRLAARVAGAAQAPRSA